MSNRFTMIFPFRGFIAPVLTAFNKDSVQSLNLQVIPKYAEFLLKLKVKGVLVNGTSGEGTSMTAEERKLVTEAWLDAARKNNLVVMVQIGGAPLPDVIEMARHAEAQGADGLLCLPELYFKPKTPADLVDYLKIVGRAAPKTPLLYYHIPMFTDVNISMSEFLKLAKSEIPTFAGIKYTHTNLEEGMNSLQVDKDLSLFLGCDMVLSGAFALGWDSAIATTLNMLPQPSLEILKLIRDGDVARAREEQLKLNRAIRVLTKNGGWVPTMKAAMNLISPIDCGEPRPPLRALTKEQVQEMKEDWEKIKNDFY